MKIIFYANTLVGPRKQNEDHYIFNSISHGAIAIVADGVGGRSCGSVASHLAADHLNNILQQNIKTPLLKALEDTNENILRFASENLKCEGMATTLTCCLIINDELKGVHVGDSRLYVLRKNGLKQLSVDHNEANKLFLDGVITKEQIPTYPRKNIITSALGLKTNFERQEFQFSLQPKDRVLLSTDGFHTLFTKAELTQFSKQHISPESYFEFLNSEIGRRRLTDNVTFVLIEVDVDDAALT